MNYIFIFLLLILTRKQASQGAQEWTKGEIANANTAVDVNYLDHVEKEALLYVNLARLYPKKFALIEVANYFGTPKYGPYLKNSVYRETLISELNLRKPIKPLLPDLRMTELAKCFARESGETGKIGHQRVKCEKANIAECCSYGMNTGRDVALQLLIDDDVPSLGHRKICLDPSYKKAGLGFEKHLKHGECLVLDLTW